MKLPGLPKLMITQKLPLAMLGSALIVGVGIGIAAYVIGLQTVNEQRVERMETSVAAGAERVRSLVASVSQDVANFAKRTDTVTQIEAMAYAFDSLIEAGSNATRGLAEGVHQRDNPNPAGERYLLDEGGTGSYDVQHKLYNKAWRDFMLDRGYDDVMLFDAKGRLVFSVQKNEDFATDFSKGSGNPLSEGEVGKLIQATAGMKEAAIVFSDFAIYGPAGKPVSFFGMPVYQFGLYAGTLVVEVSAKSYGDRLATVGGLGETGELVIVGSDGLMRVQSKFSETPNVLVTPVRDDFVMDAVNGATTEGEMSLNGRPVIAMAVPVEVGGTKWAVVATQTEAEVLAPVDNMRNVMLVVGGGLLLIAAGLGLLFSRSLTGPITRLTGTMKSLAEGNLEVEIKGAARADEIGEMARTVEVFRENALKISTHDRRGARGIGAAAHRAHDDAAVAAGIVRRSGGCGAARRLHAPGGQGVPRPGAQRDFRLDQQSGADGRARAGRDRPGAVGARPDRSHAAGDGRLSGRVPAAQDRHQCGGREAQRDRGAAAHDLAQPQDGDGRDPVGRQRPQRAHHQAGRDDRRDVGDHGAAVEHRARECAEGQGCLGSCAAAVTRTAEEGGAVMHGGDGGDGADHRVFGQDLQHHRAHRRHRVPDQPPGAQRLGGSGACR